MKSGGWGAEDSRFWCDIKIMCRFNTIRTVIRFFTAVILTCLLALISGCTHTPTIILACTLAIVAEWQSGLSENQNQYDVRLDSKFLTEENALSLEPLHDYQISHPIEKVIWSPFFAHVILKLILYTTLLLAHKSTAKVFAFDTGIQYLIWGYLVFVPFILDLSHLKGLSSFCVIEIYRMISDVILLGSILSFSLV